MTRANRYFPVWALAVAVFCSVNLSAQQEVCTHERSGTACTFGGGIGIGNPCDGLPVIVSGTNSVRIHENSREKSDRDHDADTSHVSIAMKFIGYGDDGSKDHPYRTVFIAKGQFGAEAPNYDLPFHSMWIGLKGTPSFSMDGTVRLSIDNSGTVTQSMITHLETACRAGDHDSDGDSH